MNEFRIRIETGPLAGTVRDVPESGLSVGRSKQNDLAISDALLSRRHCRFYVESGSLVVSDLATVNGTFVDGVQIDSDTPVRPGSTVKIGDTVLLASTADGNFPANSPDTPPSPPPSPSPTTTASAATEQTPDLFSEPPKSALFPPPPPKEATRRNLVANVTLACVAVVLLALAAKLFLSPAQAPTPAAPTPRNEEREPPLSFSYVKLEGSDSNVFRYGMELREDGFLEVAIDDAAQGRHVRKRSGAPLAVERRAELERRFDEASFSSAPPETDARARRNEWREVRISALLHGRPHTVVVRNGDETAALTALREALEDFGRNELGLWAFAVDRDTLLAGAEEDFERAERLHDEREVLPGNLHNAVRIYDSCIARLDTLDPRPELYDRARAARAEAAKELDARIEALNWRADHAANMKDWAEAAAALRDLAEVVPDRSDPRNEAARRRLLDAEARIGRK